MENYLMEREYLFRNQYTIIREIFKWDLWMDKEYKKHSNGLSKVNFLKEIEQTASSRIIILYIRDHSKITKFQEKEKLSGKMGIFMEESF
jgi:hypothetical protein